MDYKLVCLDIDGTLLDSENRIRPRVKEAVRAVRGLGIPVVLVSARGPGGILFLYNQLEIASPVICYNGALILDEDCSPVYSREISPAQARQAEAIARDMGLHLSVYRNGRWYVGAADDWGAREGGITRMTPAITDLSALLEEWDRQGQGPHKLLCMARPGEILAIQDRVGALDLDVYRSMPIYLEMTAKGVSKSGAIDWLVRRLGIRPDQVLAAGDNFNDLPMLLYAGMGVAMGNAPGEVKARADDVTAANDEDGVALALEKHILGA